MIFGFYKYYSLPSYESDSCFVVDQKSMYGPIYIPAVKDGDPLTPAEWNSLLDQLVKTDNPFTCPHGRPIVLRLSTRQIEVGFLRA